MKIKFFRGTSDQASSSSYVPLDGEPFWVKDKRVLTVGDGVRTVAQLVSDLANTITAADGAGLLTRMASVEAKTSQSSTDAAAAKASASTATASANAAQASASSMVASTDAQMNTTLTTSAAKTSGTAAIKYLGDELITNGHGHMQSSYNFSGMTYVGGDAPPGSVGSFVRGDAAYVQTSDEMVPIAPGKTYVMSGWARETSSVTGGNFYMGFAPCDAQGNGIYPAHYAYSAGTMTTLAADLNPGDTTIKLSSGSSWPTTALTAANTIGFWNWVDAAGKAWANYTRNILVATGATQSGGTVTLPSPYAGAKVPVGTAVSLNGNQGSFIYNLAAAVGQSTTWTKFTSVPITGYLTNGATGISAFPPGTEFVRFLILGNRGTSGTRQAFAGLSISTSVATQNAASAAQASANSAQSSATAAQDTANAARTDGQKALTYAQGIRVIQSPQMSASATLNTTASTVSTISFTPALDGVVEVTATLDVTTTTWTSVISSLLINGSKRPGTAFASDSSSASSGQRATVPYTWVASVSANTAQTLALQGAVGSGTATCNIEGTRLTVKYFPGASTS